MDRRVQAITVRINDKREFTIIEDKYRRNLAKLSENFHNLIKKHRKED